RRVGGVRLLLGYASLFEERDDAVPDQLRVAEVGGGRGVLGFGDGEVGCPCPRLGRGRRRALRVEPLVRLELGRGEDGKELVLRDRVAFRDQELRHLTGDLWADHHVVRRDDAGEGELFGAPPEYEVGDGAEDEDGEDDADDALHEVSELKQLY